MVYNPLRESNLESIGVCPMSIFRIAISRCVVKPTTTRGSPAPKPVFRKAAECFIFMLQYHTGGWTQAVQVKVSLDGGGGAFTHWLRSRGTPIRPPATFPHPMGKGKLLGAAPGVTAHPMGLTPG